MKTMPAAEFKTKCLRVLEEIDAEGLIITKHGKPIAKVTRLTTDQKSLIGAFAGKLKIKGNVFTTGIAWDAEP